MTNPPRNGTTSVVTLTARILALVLVVQLLLLAALGLILTRNARGTIAAEVAASMHAARGLVVATLATLIDSTPEDRLLAALAERLVEPRHARILVYDVVQAKTLVPATAAPRPAPAPDWFARALAPDTSAIRLPVTQGPRTLGLVVIAGDPAAEIAETWHEVRSLFVLLGAALSAQLVLTLAVLRHGLRPLSRLSDALRRLAEGDLAARAGRVGTPDLQPLAADVDRLGRALALAQADRARLSRQVVERGDQERKAIARDLHDEYGPCLFALRVEAAAIRDKAPDAATRDHAANILAIAGEIRRVNSTLLSGLRPMAVGQLPFGAVISDMIDDLAQRHETIAWTLTLDPDALPEPDEATALTIYRILQEGTTNVLRHAGARHVAARVALGQDGWRVTLSDDGRGLGGAAEGNGLTGMRERVALLGGSFRVRDGAKGVTLDAHLPTEPQP